LVSCLKEKGFTDIRMQRLFMNTSTLVVATNWSGELTGDSPYKHSNA
jgi:hypothetical protein